jgi:uncharacterized membrane protein
MRKMTMPKAKIKRNTEKKLRKQAKRDKKQRLYEKNQRKLATKLKARGETPYSSKKRKRNV